MLWISSDAAIILSPSLASMPKSRMLQHVFHLLIQLSSTNSFGYRSLYNFSELYRCEYFVYETKYSVLRGQTIPRPRCVHTLVQVIPATKFGVSCVYQRGQPLSTFQKFAFEQIQYVNLACHSCHHTHEMWAVYDYLSVSKIHVHTDLAYSSMQYLL